MMKTKLWLRPASTGNKTGHLNHARIMLLILILLLSTLTGCASNSITTPLPTPLPDPLKPQVPQTETTLPVDAPVSDEILEWLNRWKEGRPVFVMMDNHLGARPQSGLKNALMVYEFLAEGSITRYMAVFNGTGSYEVGPIRSARSYFINRALEMDALYVHVGGSPEAFNDLVRLKVGDIDGLSSGGNVFWRKKHKKIPHNMYSTLDAIRKEADRKRYKTEVSFEIPAYNSTAMPLTGEATTAVRLAYRSKSSNDGGYASSYQYDAEGLVYMRYVNGAVHVDELDGTPLSAKNLIIQNIKTRTVDKEGRLDLDDIGSGTGWFISLGTRVPITWEKADRRAKTIYRFEDGSAVKLNPGTTWIQVIPQWLVPEWNEEG